MQNKLGRLLLVLAALALLVVFTLGPLASGVAYRIAEPRHGTVEMWGTLDGLWADPYVGGGSSAT